MAVDAPPIRRVLVPTDLRPEAERAFAHGLTLALRCGATLTLAHVVPDSHNPPEWSAQPTVRAMLERWGVLEPGAELADYEALGVRVEMLALVGDPAQRLAEGGLSQRADLLVLETHGRQGMKRLMEGSVAEQIARAEGAPPALFLGDSMRPIVRAATGEVRLRRVLVPLAASGDQQSAVDGAMALLDALTIPSCQVILLHVGDSPIPDVRMPDRSGWGILTDKRNGQVVESIQQAARDHDVDLIVMATHGRDDPLDLLRGSKTERVVRSAHCPVLAVPVFA